MFREIYTVGSIAVFLCFFPNMLNLTPTFPNQVDINDLPLAKAIKNSGFKDALLINMTVASVFFFELLVLTLAFWFTPSYGKKSSRIIIPLIILWVIDVTQIITSYVLNYEVDRHNLAMVPPILSIRNTVFIGCSLCMFYTYGPEFWKYGRNISIYLMYVAGVVILGIVPYISSPKLTQIITTIVLIIYSMIVGYVCILIIVWVIQLARKVMILDDWWCTIHVTMTVGCMFFVFFTSSGRGSTVWYDRDITSLLGNVYGLSVYTVLMSVLNGQIILQEFMCERTKQESLIKQMVVGYFSHEVRTPLNSVMMGLQLLKQANCPGIEDILDDVQTSCGLVVDILNDLVTYEQVEAGEVTLQRHPVAMKPLLTSKLDAFLSMARTKGIDFQVHETRSYSASDITVLGDEEKLHQVFRNVLSNAIECVGGCGCVEVTMDLDTQLRTHRLKIDIRYSGSSVSEMRRASLMDVDHFKFTAGVIESNRIGGLGLLVAHKIVALLNGSLTYTTLSTEGRMLPVDLIHISLPTTNTLSMDSTILNVSKSQCPAEDTSIRSTDIHKKKSLDVSVVQELLQNELFVHEYQSSRATGSAPATAVTSPNGGDMNVRWEQGEVDLKLRLKLRKVLVVDDVAMNRKMLARLLVGKCSHIDEAEDGDAAVTIVRESLQEGTGAGAGYDLVLMDYQMPKMDGPTAARAMRDMGYVGPIVGVTGNVLTQQVEEYIRHGANKVLPKPLNFNVLKQVLLEMKTDK